MRRSTLGRRPVTSSRWKSCPLHAKVLQQATGSDPTLSAVLRYTREGWPSEVTTDLRPYLRRKDELSIGRGCLFLGTRVVIPAKCQKQVLEELHMGHQGIVKMKGLARSLGGLALIVKLKGLSGVAGHVRRTGIFPQFFHSILGPGLRSPWE